MLPKTKMSPVKTAIVQPIDSLTIAAARTTEKKSSHAPSTRP
jgi:hypothetical protein